MYSSPKQVLPEQRTDLECDYEKEGWTGVVQSDICIFPIKRSHSHVIIQSDRYQLFQIKLSRIGLFRLLEARLAKVGV